MKSTATKRKGVLQRVKTRKARLVLKRKKMKLAIKNVSNRIFIAWRADPRDMISLVSAVRELRTLMADGNDLPTQETINSKVVPVLIEIMRDYDVSQPDLVLDAAWVITNITAGTSDHCDYVVNVGVLPILSQLLLNPSEDVREQALWCLGNIAGDLAWFRDLVYELQIAPLLPSFLEVNEKLSIRRNTMWLICNLCRAKPSPVPSNVLPLLPALTACIESSDTEDSQVLLNAVQAVAGLADAENELIRLILETPKNLADEDEPAESEQIRLILDTPNLVSGVIKIFSQDRGRYDLETLKYSMLAAGNIFVGSEEAMQVASDAGILKGITKMLAKTNDSLAILACGTLRRMTNGSSSIERILDDPEVLDEVTNVLFRFSLDDDTSEEIARVFCNFVSRSAPDQLLRLTLLIPLPLLMCLTAKCTKFAGFVIWEMERLFSKVPLRACVESALNSSDKRFQVLLHGSFVEELVSWMGDPTDWVALLMAYGCDLRKKLKSNREFTILDAIRFNSMKGYDRIQFIRILILLVGCSVIPRVHPKVWLPKDMWRRMATFY